jgi:hypothetical protein
VLKNFQSQRIITALLYKYSSEHKMSNKRDHGEMSSSIKQHYLSCHNGSHLTEVRKSSLRKIAAALATKGKGITACDESAGLHY